jgi:hypothetical protein
MESVANLSDFSPQWISRRSGLNHQESVNLSIALSWVKNLKAKFIHLSEPPIVCLGRQPSTISIETQSSGESFNEDTERRETNSARIP